MTVEVECKVIAENNQNTFLIVKNHPFLKSIVKIQLNNEEFSFDADDVISAVKNIICCNNRQE
jgi:hypothetical protein